MIDDTRKGYRLVGGAIDINDASLKTSFIHWVHGGDAGNDKEAYTRMSDGVIEPDMTKDLPTGTSTRALFSVGPFPRTAPGDTIRFTMATIASFGYDELIKYADAAKTLYDSDFSVPLSPSPPKFQVTSQKVVCLLTGNGSLNIQAQILKNLKISQEVMECSEILKDTEFTEVLLARMDHGI